jgi:GntR family transcriptional regulator
MTRNRQPVEPFDLHDGQPGYLYLRVVEHIEARIRTGELHPGTRLPGERDLAARYGVSLSTLRRAITVLRQRGRVAVLPAKGTYITTSALN